MKELSGSASAEVAATFEESLALLAAIDRYPAWHPEVIREVEVLERDAQRVPRLARAAVHVAVGPLAKDFRFEISVEVQSALVLITRVPDSSSDPERLELRWALAPGQVRLDVSAYLDVPRLLPLGGLGDSVAQGFVEAARRELDGSSPNASASSS
jgi:Polyketide cyclase / dehydrase and lipid transport